MKELYLADLKLTVEQSSNFNLDEDLRVALDSQIVKICAAVIEERISFYKASQALMSIRYMLSMLAEAQC